MSRQNQQSELSYPHFALIYIDREGNLRHEASRSIANSRETILSPRVTNEFSQSPWQGQEILARHILSVSHIFGYSLDGVLTRSS